MPRPLPPMVPWPNAPKSHWDIYDRACERQRHLQNVYSWMTIIAVVLFFITFAYIAILWFFINNT